MDKAPANPAGAFHQQWRSPQGLKRGRPVLGRSRKVCCDVGGSLLDLVDPACRGFDGAHLDAGQGVVELLDYGAHLFHSGRELDEVAVVVDGAYGRDDRCSAAEAALGEVLDLIETYLAVLNLQA